MGIVINRPMNVDLGDVLEHMDIEAQDPVAARLPIFEGGPVQRERGFVIHRPIGEWDAMLTVSDDLGITTSRDILGAIAKGQGPHQVLIALGYAGWGAGQLEQELAENAWLSIPADDQIIFDTPPHKRWEAAAARLGVDLTLLSNEAGHA
jgi:putative transcriptional regulator